MTSLTEEWLQQTAKDARINPLSPEVVKMLLPAIETQMKKTIQKALRFQKRAKGERMLVDDFNLALHSQQQEEIYGLTNTRILRGREDKIVIESPRVNLAGLAKRGLPRCPLGPDLALHWLIVEGTQPRIPENPSTLPWNPQDHPISLSREMQHYYSSTTNAILSQDRSHLPSTFYSFANDSGLQDLVPYYSRFIFTEVRKTKTRTLGLLECIVSMIGALIKNDNLQLQYHLHQIMPAIFTCVVGSKLTQNDNDDHWRLRRVAADVVSSIVNKFKNTVPDLHVRVCKTYMDAFNEDKSLASLYGGMVGLMSMGQAETRGVLFPAVVKFRDKLYMDGDFSMNSGRNSTNINLSDTEDSIGHGSNSDCRIDREARAQCRNMLSHAIGRYMMMTMRLSSVYEFGFRGTGIGIGSSNSGGALAEESQQTFDWLMSSVEDIGELLVPYYVTSSKPLDMCRITL